jgi:hypothetical protein
MASNAHFFVPQGRNIFIDSFHAFVMYALL